MEITYFDTETLNFDIMTLPVMANEEPFVVTTAMIENYKDLGD